MLVKRIMLVVSYDGTNYCGWQVQPNAPTIEGMLNKGLTALLGEPITVTGASRTDAGVHAMGNVAVFDTATRIPAEKFCYALNQRLPEDIVIQSSKEVSAAFHPRHCDCIKTYEYKIYNAKFPSPLLDRYSHFSYQDFDIEAMKQAAGYFLGEHDFKSFCSAGSKVIDTIRRIDCLTVEKSDSIISIRVTGNGFLYNMIRIIAGTLMQVGTQVYPPEKAAQIIKGCDRSLAGPTAPAKGLTLVEIRYIL